MGFDELSWREVGILGALTIYIILNHWQDLVNAVKNVYQNHTTHVHDKREFGQTMAEREYDNRVATQTAQLSHKIANDHEAFTIVKQLLDDRRGQLNDINRSLSEITILIAKIQQTEDQSQFRFDKRLENIGSSLHLVWQELETIRKKFNE